MRDLLARLASQDEGASAALRVLEYFDALDEKSVGPEAYLRGAAGLSSNPVGMHLIERRLTLRIDASGRRLPATKEFEPDPSWALMTLTPEGRGRIWLESDERSTFHQLILERVAQGIQRWMGRMDALVPEPTQAWSILLNDPVPDDRRQQLFGALRLDPTKRYQAVARVPDVPVSGVHAATRVQGVQVGASIQVAPYSVRMAGDDASRIGIGPAVPPDELLVSWERAVVVLRIARPGEALPFDRLGVLGPLFLRATAEELLAEPIVAAIDADTMPWLDQTVTAVTQTGSVRGAADLLQLHHSTIQKRIDRLQQQFDLNLANARHVYHLWLALAAHRFATFGTPENMAGEVRRTPRPFDDPPV